MARGARLARRRAARAAAARATSWPASSASRPGPSWGGCCARLEEAAFTGEASDREQAVELARSLRAESRPVIVDCAIYEDGRRRDGERRPRSTPTATASEDGAFAWIGLYEPTEEEFDSLSREFDLHPLAVEDAIHAHQRPKLEMFGDMALLVLKTARYVDPNEVVELGEILVFAGQDFVITVRHGEASDLHGVRERLEGNPELLKRGPGRGGARDRRQGGGRLPARDRRARGGRRGGGERGLLADRPDRTERIYRLKRETLDFYHAAAPLIAPVDAAGARPLRRHPARGARLLPGRERPPAARARAARGPPRPPHGRARRRTSRR